MALTSEINSITEQLFIPKLVDNIFNSNALLQRWKKKGGDNYRMEDGGRDIVQPLLYATTTGAGWYSGADTLNTTANDQISSALQDWKYAYANITITRSDELRNSGKRGIINFVKAKVQAAEKTLADNIGTGIFNAGTTSNAIIGLRLAIDSAGTYGGINRSTYSWWSSTESSATALTIARMQAMQGDVQVDNDRPSVWAGTQDVFDSFYGLVQPQQRFQDSETAKAGFTNMLFNGKPFLVDSHVPSGHLFALNENYVGMVVHKDENFRFEPFIKPTDQNVSTAKIYWAGNISSSNCRMQGKFTSLA